MNSALSGQDILDLTNNETNIMTYPDLQKYKNIDEVLGKHGACVILYLTKSQNFGHWVCIIKQPNNTLEFFDSYGLPTDSELGFVSKEKRNYLNQNMPYLSKLLYNSKYNVIYNDRKIQKYAKDISTCGRHVICRINNRDIDIDDYCKILKSFKPHTPDYIVYLLTK